jgi:hypothetical protein
VSLDREDLGRVADTSYADGVLTIRADPASDLRLGRLFRALFDGAAPRPDRRARALPGVGYRSLGKSLDGQDIDCLTIGEGRSPSGSTPASIRARAWPNGGWKARSRSSPTRRSGRPRAAPRCTFHIVPNMNPDGSRRGHLRTNAVGVNLNREWHAPSPRRAPKCCASAMRWTRPASTSRWTSTATRRSRQLPRRLRGHSLASPSGRRELFNLFSDTLERICRPTSRPQQGYEIPRPGQANMSMSTTQLAERFGCVSMTLEMPFKDNFDLPDPVYGWSPSGQISGRACLDALHAILPELEAKPDADPRPPPPRPVAVEPREPLHRLVGRRPDRARASPKRARPAQLLRTRASTSTCCFTSLQKRAIRTAQPDARGDGPAVAAGDQGLAPERAPLWRADRPQQGRR